MKCGNITIQNQADILPKPYIGLFTRDISTGSGTQSITGLGFKPSAVMIFGVVGASDYASWGYGHASSNAQIYHTGDTDVFNRQSNYVIVLKQGSGSIDYRGAISSIDTDGFTITWSLIGGSPTGTFVCGFKAYK